MFNLYIVTVLVFNFTIITCILWLVTLLEMYINKNTSHFTKNTTYECGFWTINKNVYPISINTILLLLFVIIYEIELILLVPISLNISNLTHINYLLTIIIIYFIVCTLLIDINFKKINWIF